MHARIDQLLNLRDGEPVDAQVAPHVAQCSTCAAALQRLVTLRRRMQELPSFEPPSWHPAQISLRTVAHRGPRYAVVGIAAGIAALSIVTGWLISSSSTPDDARALRSEIREPAASLSETHLTELMDQSRQLEEMLRVLPARPVVERVTTAATIDTLEQRIQWLDLHLSYASEAGLSERQAAGMWRERVDLMDSLVKVRYAESGYTSF